MPPIQADSPIAFADPLPEAADVVIIGGGIAGVATGFHLAERGVDVLILEKGRIAAEQSSRNWGWVRQQGRDWAELPIMIEANQIWRDLARRTGESDLTFTMSGCVYVARTPTELAKFERWHGLAREHQLDTRMLTPEGIADLVPGLEGQVAGGMLTATDGRAEPFAAVPALARAAAAQGASVIENCAVRTLDIEGGCVAGVITEKGRVKCNRVVLAAGSWSSFFAANAGVNLPQLMVRSTVARTEPAPDVIGPNLSLPGLAIRRRADGGYSVSSADIAEHFISPGSFRHARRFLKLLRASARDIRLRPAAPKGYPGAWGTPRRWSGDQISPFERQRVLNPQPSAEVVRRIEERMPKFVPALKDVKLAEAWAGMIDVTPDAVPTLGEDPQQPGLFIATGLSGHGFGIGPAIGRVMADMLVGRDPGHDLRRFRPARFFDGSQIEPGPY